MAGSRKRKKPTTATPSKRQETLAPSADESASVPNGISVNIEHWRRAEQVADAIRSQWPSATVTLNAQGRPSRAGAFEIVLLESGGSRDTPTVLWTGLKKGPPRALKFPDPDHIVDVLKETLVVSRR